MGFATCVSRTADKASYRASLIGRGSQTVGEVSLHQSSLLQDNSKSFWCLIGPPTKNLVHKLSPLAIKSIVVARLFVSPALQGV
jgi:hypothetical protein